jgi:hypothetical protein
MQPHTAGKNGQRHQPLGKQHGCFIKKLNTRTTDPPHQGIFPRKMNRWGHAKTCTQMVSMALFHNIKILETTSFLIGNNFWLETTKYPSPREWTNKLWYVYAINYYSVNKKKQTINSYDNMGKSRK